MRCLVDGDSIGLDGLAYDSSDSGTATVYSLEAHSIHRVASGLGAGTHSVQVRVGHVDDRPDHDMIFRLDHWTLTTDAVLLP